MAVKREDEEYFLARTLHAGLPFEWSSGPEIGCNGRILCVRMVNGILYDGAGSGQGVD